MPKRARESETPLHIQQQASSSSSSNHFISSSTFNPPPTNNPVSRGKKPYSRDQKDGGFQQNIADLMEAFGDATPPSLPTVQILEEITLDYLTDLLHRARPSPYALPICSNKFNPNHPLNHILDENDGVGGSSGGNGMPDRLNAPTGRSGYAYPPRATIHPDDIRRALKKMAPKPILIPREKKQRLESSQGARDQDREHEELEEGVLNRPLERLEETLYLTKVIEGARARAGVNETGTGMAEQPNIADLARFGNDDD